MEKPAIDRYKDLFSALAVERAINGPLSDEEEARRAEQMYEIWEGLDVEEQTQLEFWIEALWKGTSVSRP